MEKLFPKNWIKFTEAARRHWPNVTDDELESTRGDFKQLVSLFCSKSSQTESEIRNTLATIIDETESGNPESIDDYSGIERAQESGPPPQTNEWKAREDQNERSSHV